MAATLFLNEAEFFMDMFFIAINIPCKFGENIFIMKKMSDFRLFSMMTHLTLKKVSNVKFNTYKRFAGHDFL